MKKVLFAAVALLATALTGVVTVGSDAGSDTRPTRYVVVYDLNASPAVARGAVARAGGRVVRENVKVGVATAISSRHDFLAKASRESALAGVARNKPLGSVGKPAFRKFSAKQLKAQIRAGKGLRPLRHAGTYLGGPGQHEPLAAKQWDMRMINATPEGSYSKERGDKKVLVGVLDTGVDASHPDIAPNFNRALSRNFTVDIPSAGGFVIDGPCEVEPDHSCTDPADVDENLHGTHVASTIAAPINKLGIAGVAPDVSIVNLRAGQDSGYFFLQPSVDALTFAADHGIDVVNMSYFIDPWWMNCVNNPADDSTEKLEQRTIIAATQRALDYAHLHGVTMIAAEGNEHADLGHPTGDTISPDFPDDSVKSPPRPVDNSCMIPADRRQPCDERQLAGAAGAEGRLLELRPRADDCVGSRRLVPRRSVAAHASGCRADAPRDAEPDPGGAARVRRPHDARPPQPGRDARHALGRARLRGRRVRLLHLDPGDVDGVTACCRRGRPDHLQVR